MACQQKIKWAEVPASLGYSAPIPETPLEKAKPLAKGKCKMPEQEEEEGIVKKKKGNDKGN